MSSINLQTPIIYPCVVFFSIRIVTIMDDSRGSIQLITKLISYYSQFAATLLALYNFHHVMSLKHMHFRAQLKAFWGDRGFRYDKISQFSYLGLI